MYERGQVLGQRETSTRVWSFGRSTVAVVVTSLVLVTVGLLVPSTDAGAMASAIQCTAPQGRLAVAVVVTFSDEASPTVRCANVRSGASGFDALRSAGFALRIESGFLCAIDGVPATGCASGSGFDGTYWRYFRAQPGGTWQYANTGGGYPIQTSSGCAVEGWTWSGASTITAPAYSPGLITCSHTTETTALPPTTTSPGTPATTRAPAQPPSTGDSGSGAGSSGSGVGSSGSVGSGSASGGTGVGKSGSDLGSAAGSTDSTHAPDGSGDSSDEENGITSDTAEVSDDGGAGVESATGSADGSDSSDQDEAALSRDGRASSGQPDDGSPAGLIIGGVLIMVMATAAVIVNRRRSAPPTT